MVGHPNAAFVGFFYPLRYSHILLTSQTKVDSFSGFMVIFQVDILFLFFQFLFFLSYFNFNLYIAIILFEAFSDRNTPTLIALRLNPIYIPVIELLSEVR